jgi:DNA-binding transcriptional LysR family regulator
MPSPPINLSRFDLASLRLFLLTVEAGSLTAGAERYGISLAAASKRIAELESHVGNPLLARSKRGVVPTPAGQTLMRHAIELVTQLEQMAVAMSDFQRGRHGHLRIWANASGFANFLPTLLAAFSQQYPKIAIDLEDVLSEEAAQAVSSGVAELAVIGENTPTEGLQTIVCEVDELVLVAQATHELARRDTAEFAHALEHDFVGMNRSTSLMRQIVSAASAIGKTPRIRVQVRSFDAMCRMVSAGLGIAILPRWSALPHAPAMGLVIRRLEGLWTQRRLLLAMRDRDSLTDPARIFLEMVEARLDAAASSGALPRTVRQPGS